MADETSHEAFDGLVHSQVIAHVVEQGHAPDVPTLAARVGESERAVTDSLRRLHEGHGLVLHPGSETRIWVVHPFALTPTTFWVEKEGRGWWGNCAWCSLGIAALLGGTVTIRTRAGGERDDLVIRVEDGRVEPASLVVHFSRPVARAWENVHYYCATVLAFSSQADVGPWCERRGIDRG
ncbi:MAG TPA: organomercurial lyase, partial [Longimicrobium sp.]